MPHYELEQIVDHIESVLNKPIADMLNKQAKDLSELKRAEKAMLSSSNQSQDSRKVIKS